MALHVDRKQRLLHHILQVDSVLHGSPPHKSTQRHRPLAGESRRKSFSFPAPAARNSPASSCSSLPRNAASFEFVSSGPLLRGHQNFVQCKGTHWAITKSCGEECNTRHVRREV